MTGKGIQSLIPPKEGGEEKKEEEIQVLQVTDKKTFDHSSADENKSLHEDDNFIYSNKGKGRESGNDFVFHLEVEKIKPNPLQPRKNFNDKDLNDLSISIREHGVLQPVIVSKVIKDKEYGTEIEYQLLAGERRLLAAKKAGLERIPAIIRRVNSGKNNLELALIENIQRQDLSPIESARAYSRLQDEFGMTQREIATRVGRSRESIANTIRLLNLSSEIQEALSYGKISESQGRTLLSISDRLEQDRVFNNFLEGKGTRRKNYQIGEDRGASKDVYLEKRLEEAIGSPVKISDYGGKGRIIIQFNSKEEKGELLEKLIGSSD